MVSVIMPVYNGENFLKEAIESVIAQTYTDWELIIINDGSTDKTEEIIQDFLTDKRLKYLFQENQGVAKARNNGVKKCQGEYLAFLDADDIWLSEKLEFQMKVVKRSIEPIFVCTNFFYINNNGEIKGELFSKNIKSYQGFVQKMLLTRNIISTSSVLMPKDIFLKLNGFNEKIKIKVGEDYEFWLRVSGLIKLVCLEKSLIKYRVHLNQTTKNKIKNGKEILKLYFYLFINIQEFNKLKRIEVVFGFLKRFF